MRWVGVVGVATAVALSLCAGWTRAQDPSLEATVTALSQAADRDDCQASESLVRQAIDANGFAALDGKTRQWVYAVGDYCAAKAGDWTAALADARGSTSLPNATTKMWASRIEAAVELDRADEAAEAVRALAATGRDQLDAMPVRDFYVIESEEQKAGHTDSLRAMLAALDTAGYSPSAALDFPDLLWLTYARLEADDGHHAHARQLLGRVHDIDTLIDASLDSRFADDAAADPKLFDLRADLERQLATDQALMTSRPDLLQPVVFVVRDLRGLERFDEALALVERTLQRVAAEPVGKRSASDEADELNWLTDLKADLLLDLGHAEDALLVERRAAAISENGHANVSQVINLAGFLDETGHPGQALDDLAAFDGKTPRQAGPYGKGWVHAERACADQQLHRADSVSAELSYLSAHSADNPGAQLRALLCVGDLDGAASELVALLKDPSHRTLALKYLSQWDAVSHPTPLRVVLNAGLAQVATRPDVRAAVAEAGRTPRIPLWRDSFVDAF